MDDESRGKAKRARARDKQIQAGISKKAGRRIQGQKEKHKSLWFGLGMFGLVGWSVAIPTLIGIAIGAWIDATWPSQYSWTLMLLLVGVAAGCLNAWFWVKRESEKE